MWGRSANPDAKSLDELSDAKCLVLLGEPGMGKSTCARSEQAADGGLTYAANLADLEAATDVTDEVFRNAIVQRWLASDELSPCGSTVSMRLTPVCRNSTSSCSDGLESGGRTGRV